MISIQTKTNLAKIFTASIIFSNFQIGLPVFSQSSTASNAPNSIEVTLKNMKDIVHRIRTATLDIINDVEQRNMVITGDPELIQPIAYDDTNQIGWSRKMLELGPAESPRPEWLDVDMSHLGKLISLLQSDFNSNLSKDAQPSTQEVSSILKDVQTHYKNLQKLTKGPKYNNLEIGKAALEIHDDMNKLSKPWKELLHTTQKS